MPERVTVFPVVVEREAGQRDTIPVLAPPGTAFDHGAFTQAFSAQGIPGTIVGLGRFPSALSLEQRNALAQSAVRLGPSPSPDAAASPTGPTPPSLGFTPPPPSSTPSLDATRAAATLSNLGSGGAPGGDRAGGQPTFLSQLPSALGSALGAGRGATAATALGTAAGFSNPIGLAALGLLGAGLGAGAGGSLGAVPGEAIQHLQTGEGSDEGLTGRMQREGIGGGLMEMASRPLLGAAGSVGRRALQPIAEPAAARARELVNRFQRVGVDPSMAGILPGGVGTFLQRVAGGRFVADFGEHTAKQLTDAVTRELRGPAMALDVAQTGGRPTFGGTVETALGRFRSLTRDEIRERFLTSPRGTMRLTKSTADKFTNAATRGETAELVNLLRTNPTEFSRLVPFVPELREPARRAWLSNALDRGLREGGDDFINPNAVLSEFKKLSGNARGRLFPGSLKTALDDLESVMQQSVEARAAGAGSTGISGDIAWQPLAVAIGLVTGQGVGGGPVGRGIFAGTTALVTGAPRAASAILSTEAGIKWLTGAAAASRAGELTLDTAPIAARVLAQMLRQELEPQTTAPREDVPPVRRTPLANLGLGPPARPSLFTTPEAQ